MDDKARGELVRGLRGRRVAIIYLTDWQMRLIKDFLGLECHVWVVPEDSPVNLRYGVVPGSRRAKRMYLTDWQMRELKAELGYSCEFVELEGGMIPIYSLPVEDLRTLIESQEDAAHFRIELDDSQKKHIKELFGLACETIDVPIDKSDLVKYGIPPDRRGRTGGAPAGLMLNAAQQKALREQFGAVCDSIVIDRSTWVMYRVDPGREC